MAVVVAGIAAFLATAPGAMAQSTQHPTRAAWQAASTQVTTETFDGVAPGLRGRGASVTLSGVTFGVAPVRNLFIIEAGRYAATQTISAQNSGTTVEQLGITLPSGGATAVALDNLICDAVVSLSTGEQFSVRNGGFFGVTSPTPITSVTVTVGPPICGTLAIDNFAFGALRTNVAPDAVDDAYTLTGGSLSVAAPGVLGNDTDADGDGLTVGTASDPAHGDVVLRADGSFTYTPDAGYSGPDSFTYRATDPDGASDQATVRISASADLSIVKSDDADPVRVGDTFTYTLAVSNSGPSRATGVEAVDVLPAGLSFVSASAGCANAAGTVTCDFGAVPAGAAAQTAQIVVRSDTAGLVSNTATVSGAQPDPLGTNDSDTETTQVDPTADLAIVKSADADEVVVGDRLTYTLAVSNAGPSQALAVRAVDALPAGVEFVEASPGCAETAGTVVCDFATLTAGAPAKTAQIVVQAQAVGTVTNTATVSGSRTDPAARNNSSSHTTRITSRPSGAGSGGGGVGTGDPPPTTTPAPAAAGATAAPLTTGGGAPPAAACRTPFVSLVDLRPGGTLRRPRMTLLAVASTSLAGRTVAVLRDGRRVRTGRIATDGRISVSVPAPRSASARARARYRLVVGDTRSLALKATRQATITGRSTLTDGGLRVTGRIAGVLRPTTITVQGTAACGDGRTTSSRIRTDARGRFRATLAPPTGATTALIYRVRLGSRTVTLPLLLTARARTR